MNEVNVGIIAAIISAIGLFTVWLFNYIMLRHTQAMEHNRMLLDINKMVIEYPELWTILESDTSQCSSETSGRRNAFMFLILNTGCQIFIDLNSLKFKSKLDKEKWKAWDQSIKLYISSNKELRDFFCHNKGQFEESFVKYIEKYINTIESTTNSIEEKVS